MPVTLRTPAQVIVLTARMRVLFASVPPPDVLMNVKSAMLKLEYQVEPLFGIHGETSIEKTTLGRTARTVETMRPMICPASCGVSEFGSPPELYW